MATAFVGDYAAQGYGDGDIVVITPSLQVKRLVENNATVAQFTQTVRAEHGFEGPGKGPWDGRVKALASPVFIELRRLFRQGTLPLAGTRGANELYESLFEQKRAEKSRSTERILCDALGYNFLALDDANPRANNRQVFVDRDGRAFRPNPKQNPAPPKPPAEGAEGS